MNIKTIVFALSAAAMMASCSTQRSPLPYFQDIDNAPAVVLDATAYQPLIEPTDELYVLITSSTPSATGDFNLPVSNPATASDLTRATTPQQLTYIVSPSGDIDIPQLGNVHVAGMTTTAAQEKIKSLVEKFVDNPTVVVRLQNFVVNVAGEVRSPGRKYIDRERFTVLDALSAAGDLTEFGERNNVLLIREENGQRVAHRLNLNSADLLSSPYFYVRQNDYIYVEPNAIREDNSKYNSNNAYKISVVSTIVSGVSVIASLVIALTVK